MDEQTNQSESQFQQNNGMSIAEAYQHVVDWLNAGKYQEALDGCKEIMRYDNNYEDVVSIAEQAKAKLTDTPPSTESQQTTIEEKVEENKIKTKKSDKNDEILAVTRDEKFLAAIGYISFLCILPLLLKRDSAYCIHHGKQGLVLAIIFFFYKYLGMLGFIPGIGDIIKNILSFVLIFELLIIIWAMIQAFRGKMYKMPLIYKMSQAIKI